jgi:HSP20 family protein
MIIMAEVNIQKRPQVQGSQTPERYDPFGYRGGMSPWRSPFEMLAANPFDLMRRFGQDMDQFFSSSWPGSRAGTQDKEMGPWWPAVEVLEQDGKMVVRADLPGIDKNDVKVELKDATLTIEGERKREHTEESGGFRRSERSYGSFSRTIPLPEGANADQAKAQFNNGVLEVTIPVPESQRRTIPIESGEKKQVGSETPAARHAKTG